MAASLRSLTATQCDFPQERASYLPQVGRLKLEDSLVQVCLKPPMSWQEVPIRYTCNPDGKYKKSHYRPVYIVTCEQEQVKWVVKISSPSSRRIKTYGFFPHADEVAYKICKLLGWRGVVPKTKILHQRAPSLDGKHRKYLSLVRSYEETMKDQALETCTFTIQRFAEGQVLPSKPKELSALVHSRVEDSTTTYQGAFQTEAGLASYQRAFLYNMLVDRGDARSDNTIYNPRTDSLHEIDNEYLAFTGQNYPKGILHSLSIVYDLKNKPISHEILASILEVREEQLVQMRDKYQVADATLVALQKAEPKAWFIEDILTFTEKKWNEILGNFQLMQRVIRSLIEKGSPINLNDIIAELNEIRSKDMEIEKDKEIERQQIAEKLADA